MPIHTGTSTKVSTGKIRARIIMSVVVLLALGMVGFVIVRASASQESTGRNSVSEAKSFDINLRPSGSITLESANVITKSATWALQANTLGYSDKAKRDADAEAARVAEANAAALSAAAVRSAYSTAQYAAREAPSGVPSSPSPLAPGNAYAPGYCTWYAYNRRYEMGRPVPNMLGNGGSWHINAPSYGIATDHTPEVGAVMDMSGHVAVVEVVGDNDSVFISEMNYGGLYRYNTRWVANASSYWFIH